MFSASFVVMKTYPAHRTHLIPFIKIQNPQTNEVAKWFQLLPQIALECVATRKLNTHTISHHCHRQPCTTCTHCTYSLLVHCIRSQMLCIIVYLHLLQRIWQALVVGGSLISCVCVYCAHQYHIIQMNTGDEHFHILFVLRNVVNIGKR